MTPEQPQKRRIKLINRDFQVGLMLKLIALQAVLLALFGVALYLFLRGEVGANLASAHVAYKTVGSMLFPIVLTLSLLNLALTAFTTALAVLYASHRIAGPLFRFNQALKEMGSRKLQTMTKIREDDQLAEISATLSQTRDVWAADVAEMRTAVTGLASALPESADKARKHQAEMEAILARYPKPN
jgi:hypothetical protein